jgi:hypothetical protein
MSAGLLNFIAKLVPAAANPDALPHRGKLGQLAASAQTTIELAGQILNPAAVKPLGVDLPKNLAEGNKAGDAKFLEGVRGVNDALTKPPYELPPALLK